MTVVQGNPAVPVAACGIPLGPNVTLKEFSKNLKSTAPRAAQKTETPETTLKKGAGGSAEQ
jgi:hypothetical protein